MDILQAAVEAGANAVKLQTFTPDTITLDHDGPAFTVKGGLWDGLNLYKLYDDVHMPWEWQPALFARGRELGTIVFSSVFDATSVEFLQRLDAPAYKIASPEIVDLELIDLVARTGKPVIISTGFASIEEVEEAVDTARAGGCNQLALLHCNSGYPTPDEDVNLRTIAYYTERFGCPVGLSDHTLGIGASIAAVALGAPIIERHITLARADGGPDSAFSTEPSELCTLVDGCRSAHAALGKIREGRTPSETGVMGRPSLWVVKDVKKGEQLTRDNVGSLRPNAGLPPKYLPDVMNHKAIRDLQRGTPLNFEDVDGLSSLPDRFADEKSS
jgi:N-acetylneuraminate synthase